MMDMMDISHDEDDDYEYDDDEMRWAILFSSYGSLFATHKMRGILSWKRASMFYFSFILLFLIMKLDIFGRAHFWLPTLLIKHAGPCSLDRGFLNPSVLQVVDVCCCCHWQDQKNDTPENAGCCWERGKAPVCSIFYCCPPCGLPHRPTIRNSGCGKLDRSPSEGLELNGEGEHRRFDGADGCGGGVC